MFTVHALALQSMAEADQSEESAYSAEDDSDLFGSDDEPKNQDNQAATKKILNKQSGFIDQIDDPLFSYDTIEEDELPEPDPLEPVNRAIFEFNHTLDGLIIKPFATIYSIAVNDTVQTGVRNVIDNAISPVSFANHILQGEGEKAFRTFFRFLINTTIGIFGAIDVAKEMGLEKDITTFNETLATWGVETGPYLVLPLLGPSSFRDVMGRAGDYFMDPWYYITKNKHRAHNHYKQQRYWLYVLYGMDALDFRKQILSSYAELERTSSNLYVSIRSVYFQKQQNIKQKIAERRQKTENNE